MYDSYDKLLEGELRHYTRHLNLSEIGEKGQLKLKRAKVLVIGAGGLGCPVLQYITAAGVGLIGIVDDDLVDQSNLQRQVLYTYDDIDRSKVFAAKYRLGLMNPHIEINAYNTRLTPENAIELFDDYEIIVDCTDNFASRYLVNDVAVLSNKPFVYGAIHKFEGQVSVFNYDGGPTYRCLFPEPPELNQIPNCTEIGVLGILPGIIGCLQANEVLKMILGIGEILSGQLLTYDCLTMQQTKFGIKKIDESHVKELMDDYDCYCSRIVEISYDDYEAKAGNYHLIDVRTAEERRNHSVDQSLHFPISHLVENWKQLPLDKPLLFVCQSGKRSLQAIDMLQNLGFQTNRLISLKGGLNAMKP